MAIVPARKEEKIPTKTGSNGTTFGFEITLLVSADKLHSHMDAVAFKGIVLDHIILKRVPSAEILVEGSQ